MHRFDRVFRGIVLAHLAASCSKPPSPGPTAPPQSAEAIAIPSAPSATAKTDPNDARVATLIRVEGPNAEQFSVEVRSNAAPWDGDIGPLLKQYAGVAYYHRPEDGRADCTAWLGAVCGATSNASQCVDDVRKKTDGLCAPKRVVLQIAVRENKVWFVTEERRPTEVRALISALAPSFREWEHAWLAVQLFFAPEGIDGSLSFQRLGDRWTVTGTTKVRMEGRVRTLWKIRMDLYDDGRLIDRSTLSRTSSVIMRGRRPAGLRAPRRTPCTRLGGYFARAAHAEAASVEAFARLAEELESFGAPRSLVRRAKAAMADEVRHAEAMHGLAKSFGGHSLPLRVRQHERRSFYAFAKENAVEGCIVETYAALEAHHVAAVAADRRVRASHRAIARDETRHAELAWDIAAWAESRLSGRELRRIDRARQSALRALEDELARTMAEELHTVAGVPRPEVARALCDAFFPSRIAA
ncbi:MAG: hypothetical protein U0174_08800 [Polyangiaceae bacterium]